MKSSRIDLRGDFHTPTLALESGVPRISSLVRRKKNRGALFENSSSSSHKRANISVNALFAHRALSSKWNSQNEWD